MLQIAIFTGLLIVSLTILIKAADWFINAAERIGLALGISSTVMGITVVAFGTSLPELATSIAAVWAGTSEIVLGNVVGSNIANLLLVLGVSAFAAGRIRLDKSVLDVDVPLLVGASMLLWFALQDEQFSLFESAVFLLAMGLFLFSSLRSTTRKRKEDRPSMHYTSFAMLLFGGSLIYGGAESTIYSIKMLAQMAGVSPEVIALTAVAVGTSLPEVVVSVQAARKGKSGMAVGNVIGSNVFNTYTVIGIARLFGPLIVPADTLHFSLPFMIGITLVVAFMAISGRLSRWEGGTLVLLYVFFIGTLLYGTF